MDMFGDITWATRLITALILGLALMALIVWLLRRFGKAALGAAGARGRQPRLAVMDTAAVDARRKLILIRRDNVEHLLMIGGPSDLVIEPHIFPAAMADPDRGLQIVPAVETVPRLAPREKHSPISPRQQLLPDSDRRVPPQVASLAPDGPDPGQTMSTAEGPAKGAQTAPAVDPNVAETAQRLKAALHRPPAGEPSPDQACPEHPGRDAAMREATAGASDRENTEERSFQAVPGRSPSKQFCDSIEQEMSSLLGRNRRTA